MLPATVPATALVPGTALVLAGAALGMGVILFVVGAAYVFSLDYLDFVDFLTGNLLLPLGGLLAVIFAGSPVDSCALVAFALSSLHLARAQRILPNVS